MFEKLMFENQEEKKEFVVLEKYKKLGFKETGSVNNYINMECNKYKIDESLKELSQEKQEWFHEKYGKQLIKLR